MKPIRSSDSNVPKAVVNRMSLYLRELQQLMRAGTETISSSKLGRRLGVTDAQVRKDIGYFGQFGYPGIGYRIDELVTEIKRILGTDKTWPVAMVGCGNLGQALLGYQGFHKQGFRLVAAFDTSPELVGEKFGTLTIQNILDTAETLPRLDIRLAILAVPANSASKAVDVLVEAGIVGILNFAPVTLNPPNHVSVIGVDLAMEMEQLAFAVVKKANKQ